MNNCKKIKPIFVLVITTVILAFMTGINLLLSRQYPNQNIYLILFITFLTTMLHLALRLIVGEIITLIGRHHLWDYNRPWFQLSSREKQLYKVLKVRKWKNKLITAIPEQFDLKERSCEELLQNMTQAEIVHEISMIASFVPMLLIIPYGEAAVFIITSVAGCVADWLFVIIQRFNRPRVLRLMKRRCVTWDGSNTVKLRNF